LSLHSGFIYGMILLVEAGGGWWRLVEAGGGWWRLVEAGGCWWRLVGASWGIARLV
jgi:hypothetical protein